MRRAKDGLMNECIIFVLQVITRLENKVVISIGFLSANEIL